MQLSSRAVDREAAREFFTHAIPDVYGYLLHRLRDRVVAEDLTSETMVAAIRGLGSSPTELPSLAWLIGIARHKLLDHWRREARDQRHLEMISANTSRTTFVDDVPDAGRAQDALALLSANYRAVLTLRYVDQLSVAEVATLMQRSFHATEKLLVRARAELRDRYYQTGAGDD
ncbi:MAG TPA: RNA polymerase sigma factor [Ilumatobacteraceae bacterium]|nr:RNA polymerase sigma factor [Ilumatobacteraceae bacterium]